MAQEPILVLGLGNPLVGDDGLGVAFAQRYAAELAADDVEVMDGGTQGLYLLPHMEGRRRIIIVDAVRSGAEPGTLLRLTMDQIPLLKGLKLSQHQTTFKEVLGLLTLLDTQPEELIVLGVVPAQLDWAAPLSAIVEARLPDLAAAAQKQIAAWREEDRTHAVDERAARAA
jgi:hydrogenase maturation protease